MGYSNWKTADTKKSIMDEEDREVFLLQPNKKGNIRECHYGGYCDFGGVDAFEWLANYNISKELIEKAKECGYEIRVLGIYLDSDYYIDSRSGKKYSFMLSKLFSELNNFTNYGVKIDGITVNDLIESGVFKKRCLTDFLGEVNYPLKFSFNRNAIYENLDASESVSF